MYKAVKMSPNCTYGPKIKILGWVNNRKACLPAFAFNCHLCVKTRLTRLVLDNECSHTKDFGPKNILIFSNHVKWFLIFERKSLKKTVKITSPDLLCSMQYQLPSLRLSCSTKLGSVVVLHSTVRWFLIIERKSCQNNFPGASLLSVQCTVHSVRASSAASVLFREVRQRVFCPPGQPWIHYFSLVLHQSFEFLWIQSFLDFCICVLYRRRTLCF